MSSEVAVAAGIVAVSSEVAVSVGIVTGDATDLSAVALDGLAGSAAWFPGAKTEPVETGGIRLCCGLPAGCSGDAANCWFDLRAGWFGWTINSFVGAGLTRTMGLPFDFRSCLAARAILEERPAGDAGLVTGLADDNRVSTNCVLLW